MSFNPAKDGYVPRFFGYFDYLALQGIPAGLKPPPPHLSVPSPYGLTKPVGRNVISPVHHQSSPHSNTAGFSLFGSNVNSTALNATRTSSFAAALRKLAKQAVDPVGEKDLTPVSPASSPVSSQQSSHLRHHASLPMYLNRDNSNSSGHRASPPVPAAMQTSQGKALDLGRYSNSSRSGNMPEPVSLKMDNSSSKITSSVSDKRNDPGGGNHMNSNDQLSLMSLRHEQTMSSRGFQPYRNAEDHHSNPPHLYNPSSPPTTIGGYAYHPSFSQLPPQPYRLEEPVYLERYGLLHPTAMLYPPSSNIHSHPRAPFHPAGHYMPELMSSQSVRTAPSNATAYPPSRYSMEEESSAENNMSKRHEMESYRDRERYMERKEEREYRDRELEYMRKERHLRQSPILHPQPTRPDIPPDEKGYMGSITHGTPRDYVRRMSPPSSSVPLNLATNVMNAENELDEEHAGKIMKYRNKTHINGHVLYKGGVNYRKETDAGSYVSYQIKPENHQKSSVPVESTESTVITASTKVAPFYMERDFSKPEQQVETRTLSMASVINSQINGIFAREKFVSNNSYDYFNSLTSNHEKSIFPDNSQKAKPEPKSALPDSDSNFKTSKPSIGKSQDRPKSENSSNKLPPFLFNEHSFQHGPDQNNYAPLVKDKEPSITRALLQNPATKYENDSSHTFEKPLPKILSVLDRREDRLKRMRKSGELVDSDYSDPDSDEEDTERLRHLLKITKGPSPKKKLDQKQTQFLSQFSLITHTKKELLELKKCVRRHRALREKSFSPTPEETAKPPALEYDPKHLAELSKRLCLAEDFQSKTDFFKMLCLVYVTPEQKAEKEKVMKVIENERLRRNGLLEPSLRCIELQGPNLGKRALNVEMSDSSSMAKKQSVIVNSLESIKQEEPMPSEKIVKNYPPSVSLKPLKPGNSGPRISAFLKPPFRSGTHLPVPPLIPASRVIPSVIEPAPVTEKVTTAVVAPKDPRILKEFAQEFHNSVLQTTQMKLAEKKSAPAPVHVEVSFQKPPSLPPPNTVSPVDKAEAICYEEYRGPGFQWPGIEAIMESYECHISEQTAERSFLVNNCQKLKTVIQESTTTIECLGQKSEELVLEQKLLERERRDLQSKIEAIGIFIQHFR